MSKKTNQKTTDKRAADALQRLIDFAAENRGTISVVTKRVSEITGTEVAPQMVGTWLYQDPEGRVEPKLGMGLILLQVADEIIPPKWYSKKEISYSSKAVK